MQWLHYRAVMLDGGRRTLWRTTAAAVVDGSWVVGCCSSDAWSVEELPWSQMVAYLLPADDGSACGQSLQKKMNLRDLNPLVVVIILAGLDRASSHLAGARHRQPWLLAMEMTMEHHTGAPAVY
ncbi:hypothetical protein ACLOJK_014843 [Asimina triloba]